MCFGPSVAVDQLARDRVWHCDCLERKASLHRVDWSNVVIASIVESPPWNLLPIRRLGVVELEADTSVMPKSLKPITYLDCWRLFASGHWLACELNNENPANLAVMATENSKILSTMHLTNEVVISNNNVSSEPKRLREPQGKIHCVLCKLPRRYASMLKCIT